MVGLSQPHSRCLYLSLFHLWEETATLPVEWPLLSVEHPLTNYFCFDIWLSLEFFPGWSQGPSINTGLKSPLGWIYPPASKSNSLVRPPYIAQTLLITIHLITNWILLQWPCDFSVVSGYLNHCLKTYST